MPIELLTDMIIIFGLSTAVIILFHRLRLPAVVGFIVTGMLAGPHGLGLIKAVENVDILAEIGIVALLFTIGLEFSLRNLLQIRRAVVLGGLFQVGVTTITGLVIARAAGFALANGLFFGFLLSLSSTAIVMKIAQDRGEIDTPHGRTALAILIFQDLIVVPMILVTPILAGTAMTMSSSLVFGLFKGFGAIMVIFAGAKWIVPYLLRSAAATRNREIFLLVIVIICLSIAWLTHTAGLSLALGSFLAGLIISESEYSHQAAGHVLPFRDVFTSYFFVSIGMLLDISFFLENVLPILGLVFTVLVVKTFCGGGAALIQGLPLRTAVMAGLFLSQVGEFSFILARVGASHGLIGGETYGFFLVVTALTMAMTPFVMATAHRTAIAVVRMPFPQSWKKGRFVFYESKEPKPVDHIIIVGFGLNGRNVARAAKKTSLPYVILETNPETVQREKAKGEPIFFGDATSEAVLIHAGIKEARSLVVVINDAVATRRITAEARRLNPRLHILVRTRFLQEMEALYNLGADEVIPEEFETSVEIFSRVLRRYLVPKPEIERFVAETRADGYEMFRSLSPEAATCTDIKICLPDTEVATFRLAADASAAGRTIGELALRKRHGLTVLALRRGAETVYNPDADTRLEGGDIIIAFGEPDRLATAAHLFTAVQSPAVNPSW